MCTSVLVGGRVDLFFCSVGLTLKNHSHLRAWISQEIPGCHTNLRLRICLLEKDPVIDCLSNQQGHLTQAMGSHASPRKRSKFLSLRHVRPRQTRALSALDILKGPVRCHVRGREGNKISYSLSAAEPTLTMKLTTPEENGLPGFSQVRRWAVGAIPPCWFGQPLIVHVS